METPLLIALLALVSSFGACMGVVVVYSRPPSGPGADYDDAEVRQDLESYRELTQQILTKYESIEEWRDSITTAVGQGISHVKRAENRINQTVKRARKSLAEQGVESPALEAESAELRDLNADGRDDEPVPALPNHVESPAFDLTGIPGDFAPEDLTG